MDFDNLPHHVLMKVLRYVSIQDRLENVRLVSKWWKSVAEDSLRRQRKLIWIEDERKMKMRIKPTDHHSIIKHVRSPMQLIDNFYGPGAWYTGIKILDTRYCSHLFSLCPNLEELCMYDLDDSEAIFAGRVTELLNLMHSHGIKLKSFAYTEYTHAEIRLTKWPFPLEILESLAVGSVFDELVVKILDESTNLKHLELDDCHNWSTFPSGLLSLKSYINDEVLSYLIKSPAFHTIESLEGIRFDEECDPQTKVFPKLHHASFNIISLGEERCLEICNKLSTFLVEKVPLLESLGLYWDSYCFRGAVDILFSIPQFVDVLRRLKKLYIHCNSRSTTVNILNVLRSCQNTELSMEINGCLDEDGNMLNDVLSFLVEMSGNIKYFKNYYNLIIINGQPVQPVKVAHLDVLRQLHTSHEIVLVARNEMQSVDFQNFVTEEERQKFIKCIEIMAR